ncbi:ACP phosphodiesterase [Motiliproteus sediminis]|uniref:acyl carrier protein phosphodiesterase n=1 Tax=Motiliproteus sediminis TaxID=1468178 RepID=UPI001AEFDCC5|nr:ACP phosphodiesterase [Motiliproteus sediminis]
MNYLAHLYFADPTPESRVGNLMGDFYRGSVSDTLPAAVREGILLHRRIDAFTDQHPVVAGARQRLQGPRRRFAGIIIDLTFDHFLCRHWPRYHSLSLAAFLDQTYADLARYTGPIPARMREPLRRLYTRRWLAAYAELEGIDTALARTADRLSRPTSLAQGGEEVRRHYRALEQDFEQFFPALINYVKASH